MPTSGEHESRIAVLEDRLTREIQNNRDRTDLLFKSRDDALDHQFNEWMRRLTDLNGEAGRLREMQAKYVPREVFESKLEDLAKGVRALENFQSNMLGKIAVVSGVASLLGGGVVATLIAWLKGQ